jgi:anti-sigma B factor antagonist
VNVNIDSKGAAVVARVLDAQLGADSAEEFKNKVTAAIPADSARLAIDLTQVDFVDSSGLGALVSLLKAVRPSGDLVLFGMRPGVKEILRLTHLDAVFRCETTEEAALANFAQAS